MSGDCHLLFLLVAPLLSVPFSLQLSLLNSLCGFVENLRYGIVLLDFRVAVSHPPAVCLETSLEGLLILVFETTIELSFNLNSNGYLNDWFVNTAIGIRL